MLGGMPKFVKTSKGKEISFDFYIYNHADVPTPLYLNKKVWLYERMGLDKFLKALVNVLEEVQIIKDVTKLGMRAYFSGTYIGNLVLFFEIEEWYHRKTLDDIINYLQKVDNNTLIIQEASLFLGSFTIEFRYKGIYIPFKEVEELLIDGD